MDLRWHSIDHLRYLGALLLVLALIGGAGLAARRFGVPGVTKRGRATSAWRSSRP